MLLKIWIVPIAVALFWIVLFTTSLVELATLNPSLRAYGRSHTSKACCVSKYSRTAAMREPRN